MYWASRIAISYFASILIDYTDTYPESTRSLTKRSISFIVQKLAIDFHFDSIMSAQPSRLASKWKNRNVQEIKERLSIQANLKTFKPVALVNRTKCGNHYFRQYIILRKTKTLTSYIFSWSSIVISEISQKS